MTIKRKSVAIWSIVASMLFLSSALPSAYGLEFPVSSAVEIQGDATAIWPPLQWVQCSLQI
ncbi:MAG: hypothetical protein RL290_1055 [Actinomycetota bacterium]